MNFVYFALFEAYGIRAVRFTETYKYITYEWRDRNIVRRDPDGTKIRGKTMYNVGKTCAYIAHYWHYAQIAKLSYADGWKTNRCKRFSPKPRCLLCFRQSNNQHRSFVAGLLPNDYKIVIFSSYTIYSGKSSTFLKADVNQHFFVVVGVRPVFETFVHAKISFKYQSNAARRYHWENIRSWFPNL